MDGRPVRAPEEEGTTCAGRTGSRVAWERAWREVPVRNGIWTGPVSTDGVVAKQGGWVYILGVRERDRRYQRINVLTKQLEKDVEAPAFADPPGTGGGMIEKVLGK